MPALWGIPTANYRCLYRLQHRFHVANLQLHYHRIPAPHIFIHTQYHRLIYSHHYCTLHLHTEHFCNPFTTTYRHVKPHPVSIIDTLLLPL